MYTGADPKKELGSLFYLNLLWAILLMGRKLGFEMHPILDSRPLENREGPPPELAQAKLGGPIDAYIAIMVHPGLVTWIQESGSPYALMTSAKSDYVVKFDFPTTIRSVIARLAWLGCRSLGFMIPPETATANVIEAMDECSEEFGVTVNYEWIVVTNASMELKGYQHFESLWDLKNHPDGIFIFPDVTARGVVSAIVERRINVPQDLKLVLHRNVETPYVVPFACDWVEISSEPIAKALFRILDRQWSQQAPFAEKLVFELVEEQ